MDLFILPHVTLVLLFVFTAPYAGPPLIVSPCFPSEEKVRKWLADMASELGSSPSVLTGLILYQSVPTV